MKFIAALMAALWMGSASADPIYSVSLDYTHVSNLFKGKPFNNKDEPQFDSVGIGFNVLAGKRRYVFVRVEHGVQTVNRGDTDQYTSLLVSQTLWRRERRARVP